MTAPHGKPSTSDPPVARGPVLVLRDSDQRTVAVLVLIAIVCIAVPYWQLRDRIWDVGVLGDKPAEPLEFHVDLNRASWPELMLLPEIGEKLAKRIVASRESEGPFRRANDLLRVRGIGPKKLARIEPHLRFGPLDSPSAKW